MALLRYCTPHKRGELCVILTLIKISWAYDRVSACGIHIAAGDGGLDNLLQLRGQHILDLKRYYL